MAIGVKGLRHFTVRVGTKTVIAVLMGLKQGEWCFVLVLVGDKLVECPADDVASSLPSFPVCIVVRAQHLEAAPRLSGDEAIHETCCLYER